MPSVLSVCLAYDERMSNVLSNNVIQLSNGVRVSSEVENDMENVCRYAVIIFRFQYNFRMFVEPAGGKLDIAVTFLVRCLCVRIWLVQVVA